ncbi:hypothetical protein [Leptolyngbya ectocarpi]|uniref:hypothetical protein n=1 Tax=Leptolyngbya ectocarpi TaxID=1202 RepID=UPI001D150701|nr:hypothetical protein [Leptolyngbya ectocarpi]
MIPVLALIEQSRIKGLFQLEVDEIRHFDLSIYKGDHFMDPAKTGTVFGTHPPMLTSDKF